MTIPGLTRAVAAEVVGVVRLPTGVDHTSSPVQVYRTMVDRCRVAASSCVRRVQSGKPYRARVNCQVGSDHAVICYSKTSH